METHKPLQHVKVTTPLQVRPRSSSSGKEGLPSAHVLGSSLIFVHVFNLKIKNKSSSTTVHISFSWCLCVCKREDCDDEARRDDTVLKFYHKQYFFVPTCKPT